MIQGLIELIQKVGKPSRILVSDERTLAFFKNIAPAFGAKLVKRKRIPALIEARKGFSEQSGGDIVDGDIEDMLLMLAAPPVSIPVTLRSANRTG